MSKKKILTPQEQRAIRNSNTFTSTKFHKACDKAGVKPTKRQASKFSRKIGLAYQKGR